jgi:hypothetical protein
MTELHERLTVVCPLDDLALVAAAYTATLASDDGLRILPLHAVDHDGAVVRIHARVLPRHAHVVPGFPCMDVRRHVPEGRESATYAGTVTAADGGAIRARRIFEAAREILGRGLELAFQTGAFV